MTQLSMLTRASLEDAARAILSIPPGINEEVRVRTPQRFALAWEEILDGYAREQELEKLLTTFEKEGAQHLVIMTNIPFYSTCEHHLMPFWGKVHIGYIPSELIIGASKLPRLVDIFSRRLQLQERLTSQLAGALAKHLAPLGVAVVIEGEHLCMAMRGVRSSGGALITSEMYGVFQSEPAARSEFLSLCRRPGSTS